MVLFMLLAKKIDNKHITITINHSVYRSSPCISWFIWIAVKTGLKTVVFVDD